MLQDDWCGYDPAPEHKGANCTGHVDIPKADEDALKKAVATVGPIAVAIDATHQSFQLYRSGVYDETACSNKSTDHAVLVVGYGTLNGQDYWLVKNRSDNTFAHVDFSDDLIRMCLLSAGGLPGV